jgi:hypothetical protein
MIYWKHIKIGPCFSNVFGDLIHVICTPQNLSIYTMIDVEIATPPSSRLELLANFAWKS